MTTENLGLSGIRATAKNQTRLAINEDTLADYIEICRAAKAKAADPDFPPLDVFRDEEGVYWLADGFTRRAALTRTGYDTFKARVHKGGKREAIEYGFKANIAHGARLTAADKKHNLALALEDSVWAALSNTALAELVGVSEAFVREHRPVDKKPETVVAKSGKKMKTANIGKKGGVTPRAKKKAPKADEPSKPKTDKEYDKAIANIEKHAPGGEKIVKSIKDGALPMTYADVKKWGLAGAALIAEAAPLITEQRWSPKKAFNFLDQEVGPETRGDHLCNLANAHGGLLQEKIGDYKVVVFDPARYEVGESPTGIITIKPRK